MGAWRARTGVGVGAGVVLCALAVVTARATPFAIGTPTATGPRDAYVVTFRAGTSSNEQRAGREDVVDSGGEVKRTFSHALTGFAADMSAQAAADLRTDPDVLRVAPDAPVLASEGVDPTPPWDLDRIDQRARTPPSSSYSWDGDGSGVTVYVVDTGIRSDHTQLAGRVGPGISEIPGDAGTEDCVGHGTHVAGTIAGSEYGVAKGATVVPVRVLGCTGAGTTSGVVAGLDWVAAHAVPGRSVVNMSLGTAMKDGPDPTVDGAVEAIIAKGIPVVAAAGNEGGDACSVSPSDVPDAITVGAVDETDARPSFSNFGSCVDLFAPGVNVTSAWYTSPTATAILSGTSQATPHVAGAVAILLQEAGGAVPSPPAALPAAIAAELNALATRNVLAGVGAGSPNALLFTPPRDRLAGVSTSTLGSFLLGAALDPDALAPAGTGLADAFDAVGTATITAQNAVVWPACSLARPTSQATARSALLSSVAAGGRCLQFAAAESLDLSPASTRLAYVPIARDNVTFAVGPTSNFPRDLTLDQLRSIYRCDIDGIAGLHPMLPPAGSGLREFWTGLMYPDGMPRPLPPCVEDGTDEFGAPITPNGGAQINDSEIAPISMAQWTTQAVGIAQSRLGRAVVGQIDGASPFTAAFGVQRDLYAVVPASSVTGTAYNDLRLQRTFLGANSLICQAVAGTLGRRYFLQRAANCGSTSLQTS